MSMDHADPMISGVERSQSTIEITFDPGADRLIGLGFTNGFLQVLTLGIYSAWAKTEVRRKLWSFTRLNGEPLEYTGTGRELFIGFLIVFALVLLPTFAGGAAISILFPGRADAVTAYQLAVYTLFLFLVGTAFYRAQRYRLSRTQWRGIRGALVGSAGQYGWTYFWTLAGPAVFITAAALLAAWSIGPDVGGTILLIGFIAALWILPWRANKLQRMMTDATRFGDRPVTYTGTPGPLYARYLYAWAGSAMVILAGIAISVQIFMASGAFQVWTQTKQLPSLEDVAKLAAVWISVLALCATITASYRASQIRHFARHTHFDGASFRSNVSGPRLAWLILSNWLLRIGAIVTAISAGSVLIYVTGAIPKAGTTDAARIGTATLDVIFIVVPIIVMSAVATAFAQFRSTRYLVASLSLDGVVDIDTIMQNQDAAPKRGEGLAQVFDIDGF